MIEESIAVAAVADGVAESFFFRYQGFFGSAAGAALTVIGALVVWKVQAWHRERAMARSLGDSLQTLMNLVLCYVDAVERGDDREHCLYRLEQAHEYFSIAHARFSNLIVSMHELSPRHLQAAISLEMHLWALGTQLLRARDPYNAEGIYGGVPDLVVRKGKDAFTADAERLGVKVEQMLFQRKRLDA